MWTSARGKIRLADPVNINSKCIDVQPIQAKSWCSYVCVVHNTCFRMEGFPCLASEHRGLNPTFTLFVMASMAGKISLQQQKEIRFGEVLIEVVMHFKQRGTVITTWRSKSVYLTWIVRTSFYCKHNHNSKLLILQSHNIYCDTKKVQSCNRRPKGNIEIGSLTKYDV